MVSQDPADHRQIYDWLAPVIGDAVLRMLLMVCSCKHSCGDLSLNLGARVSHGGEEVGIPFKVLGREELVPTRCSLI